MQDVVRPPRPADEEPTSQPAPWYRTIERMLLDRIKAGAFAPGTLLHVAPLAVLFQTSRIPVARALARLEAEGVLQRHGRRGYVVGGETATPSAADLSGLAGAEEALASRGAWQRIEGVVEEAVASASVFGQFHVVEAELAKHFKVSRTIAHEVLGRLHERGLVRKNQSSHWIAGPLSAQLIRERYELRRLLEPPALAAAMPRVGLADLELLHARFAAAEAAPPAAEEVDALEDAFHEQVVLPTPNLLLGEAIRRNRLPLMAGRRSLRRLGLPADAAVLVEHRLVLDLLLRDSVAAAAAAFDAHLAAAARRSVAHLKTVAVIPEPSDLPPYLLSRRP
jgi:DNA-binding GntR family transcriptional regulator